MLVFALSHVSGAGTLLCELRAVSRDSRPGLVEGFSHEGLGRCLSFWESFNLIKIFRWENDIFSSESTDETGLIGILCLEMRSAPAGPIIGSQHTFSAASSIIWRKSIFLPFDLPRSGIPKLWADLLRPRRLERTHSGSTTTNSTTKTAAVGDSSRHIWATSRRVNCHRLKRRPANVCVMTI